MRLIKKLSAVLTLALLLFSHTAFANNNVSEIDIEVTVRNDGSAYVVQNWTGTFSDGTENYIPINTGDIEISDLKVSDEYGEYENIGDWNVDASFDEKKRKCGINETADGVELCFGISEYGERTYSIEYIVTDFIKSYTDFDGTNFMFVNPGMSTFPTDAKTKIVMEDGTPLSDENAAIWAFGFEGQVEFSDGAVVAYTNTALADDNYMIVMLRLNKGIISPLAVTDKSFEEVKDTAFEGSDYGYDDYDDEDIGVFGYIIGFAIMLIIPALVILLIVFLVKRKKEIKRFYNEAGYFRETPNNGEIEVSHYLAQNFDVSNDESLIIGALFLSMINSGSLEPQIEENVGFFGKTKQSVNMKLLKEPESPIERVLYNVLTAAAGSDGILQEKELEKYAYKHPKSINGIIDGAKKQGEAKFISYGGFSDGAGNRIKDLSDSGRERLAEVMGLKKYLEEFSLISERSVIEAEIWQEYMVYATLFGIADKVMKELEKVYPDRIAEFETYNRNVVIAHSYYHSMHNSAERAVQEARTSGLGGSSSIGGGGGFSGGGYGGGSR